MRKALLYGWMALAAASLLAALLWPRDEELAGPAPALQAPGPLMTADSAASVRTGEAAVSAPRPDGAKAPSSDARPQRRYAQLQGRFPAGLLNEGQQALRANHVQRALEVAKEVEMCLYDQEVQAEFEQQGWHAQLAKLRAGEDPAERARVEAFCQTAGPQAQQLVQHLVMLGVRQGETESVHWASDAGLDPSGSADRLVGRWALAGEDYRALGRALSASDPERLGLTTADVQVIRKASALLLETPEYATRQAFRDLLESVEARAFKSGAGAAPRRFIDLNLPAADEQRARNIAEALARRRRELLAAVKG